MCPAEYWNKLTLNVWMIGNYMMAKMAQMYGDTLHDENYFFVNNFS